MDISHPIECHDAEGPAARGTRLRWEARVIRLPHRQAEHPLAALREPTEG